MKMSAPGRNDADVEVDVDVDDDASESKKALAFSSAFDASIASSMSCKEKKPFAKPVGYRSFLSESLERA